MESIDTIAPRRGEVAVPAPQLPQGHVVAGKYSIQAPIGGTSGPTITYSAVTAQGRQVALKMFDMAIRQHAEAMGTIERIYQVLGSLPPDGHRAGDRRGLRPR
jgi:hypothetical protein